MIENDKKNIIENLESFDKDEANMNSFLEKIKKGAPPTANLAPTASFIKNVVAGIGAKTALTASSATVSTASTTTSAVASISMTTKLIVGGIISLAMAGAVAYFSSSNGKLASSIKGSKSEETKNLVIEAEVKELKESNHANLTPVLKFGSPSENVD